MHDEVLILILVSVVCGAIAAQITNWLTGCSRRANQANHFNSGYDRNSNDPTSKPELTEPLFYIDKIETVYTSNGTKPIAKYTCFAVFLTSKESSKINRFVFYGTIGQYNVGDEVRLILKV